MDIELVYEETKSLLDKLGIDGFIQYFNDLYKFDFFSCSKDWYDNRRYICKLKGAKGDLIISWK